MKVEGEARLFFTRDTHTFQFQGLVVEDLDVDILAGTPFMSVNDIAVRPARRQDILGDGSTFIYGSAPVPHNNTVRRATVLRAPSSPTTIWPGEFLEINLPPNLPADSDNIVEPRLYAPSIRKCSTSEMWPLPTVLASVAGRICIPNLSAEPHTLKRHEHFCQVDPLSTPCCDRLVPAPGPSSPVYDVWATKHSSVIKHSDAVRLDPDNLLPPSIQNQFRELLTRYDRVFDPAITAYNGAVGPFQARVNMGPVELPPAKGSPSIVWQRQTHWTPAKVWWIGKPWRVPTPWRPGNRRRIPEPFLLSEETKW